jgi:hypothetical protein
MTEDLVKLLAGFLLTTLCGNWLASVFQRRQARYQWLKSRWEKELAEAQAVFEEVSRLLDRRLYRARQLLWSFDRPPETRDQRLSDYRSVVTEWNDNINRILALLAIHFSDRLRNTIDNVIGAEFVAIGRSLEQGIHAGSVTDVGELERKLDALAGQVYVFNLDLLQEIKKRRQTLMEDSRVTV